MGLGTLIPLILPSQSGGLARAPFLLASSVYEGQSLKSHPL